MTVVVLVFVAVCALLFSWSWDRTTIGHRDQWGEDRSRGIRVPITTRLQVRFTGRPEPVLVDPFAPDPEPAGEPEDAPAEEPAPVAQAPKLREHRVRSSQIVTGRVA